MGEESDKTRTIRNVVIEAIVDLDLSDCAAKSDGFVQLTKEYEEALREAATKVFDHWLNQVKAEAWDKGYDAGVYDEAHVAVRGGFHSSPLPNPYRADRIEAPDA